MAGVQRCAACGMPIRCSARREESKGTRREDTMPLPEPGIGFTRDRTNKTRGERRGHLICGVGGSLRARAARQKQVPRAFGARDDMRAFASEKKEERKT